MLHVCKNSNDCNTNTKSIYKQKNTLKVTIKTPIKKIGRNMKSDKLRAHFRCIEHLIDTFQLNKYCQFSYFIRFLKYNFVLSN